VPRLSIVTTSWDDGDPLDMKVAELLRARALPGTFYFPFSGLHGRLTLDAAGLRSLRAAGFEIGAHSLSHPTLPKLGHEEISREVRTCKRLLEDILGNEIRMFCYPKGKYSATVIKYLKEAGYEAARTTRMLSTGLNFAPFEMPTSLHAYPHTRAAYLRNIARARNLSRLYDYLTRLDRTATWVDLGKALFDRVLEHGGVWHLYGHSWLIEELGLWDELKQMLDYVSNRDGVVYVPNCDVLNFLPVKSSSPPVKYLSFLK
jgi:peptidoglycan/xylan/chitin deacetylase (PgdA/CDA1 family)